MVMAPITWERIDRPSIVGGVGMPAMASLGRAADSKALFFNEGKAVEASQWKHSSGGTAE